MDNTLNILHVIIVFKRRRLDYQLLWRIHTDQRMPRGQQESDSDGGEKTREERDMILWRPRRPSCPTIVEQGIAPHQGEHAACNQREGRPIIPQRIDTHKKRSHTKQNPCNEDRNPYLRRQHDEDVLYLIAINRNNCSDH